MKHSLLTYTLLAALCVAVPAGAQEKAAPAPAAAADKAKADKAAAEAAKRKAADEARAKERAEKERKWQEARKKREAEALAKKKAWEEFLEKRTEIRDFVNGLEKKKIQRTDRANHIRALLKDPRYADPRLQVIIYENIITYAEVPSWMTPGRYSYEAADKCIAVTVDEILKLDQSVLANSKKTFAIRAMVQHFCVAEKLKEAADFAKKCLELPDLDNVAKAKILTYLAEVYRYEDRYEDALKLIREAIKLDPVTGAQAGAQIALHFRKPDDALTIWDEANNLYEKLIWCSSRDSLQKRLKNDAIKFVLDEKNQPIQRVWVAKEYLAYFYGTEEEAKARKSLKGIPAELKLGGWRYQNCLSHPFQMRDYKLVVEWADVYEGSPLLTTSAANGRIHVISLGALGKNDEAVKKIAEYQKNPKLTPKDTTLFKVYEAILSGKPIEGIIKDAKLPRKDEASLYQSAARTCLTAWNRSDLAEKYSAAYEKYFMEKPVRSMNVPYFDKPVVGVADWRLIYDKLEKQYCDIPFKGAMDFLETDVATGDRSYIKIDKNAQAVKTMELTALCDAYGLHVFLRAEAENARSIEAGFARGIGTDMYFAPGRNQPYICMGSRPATGISYVFNTTYNNKNHRRITDKDPRFSLKSEVEFTDNDYVLHLFFSWDQFYNKLPANGSEWRYECLAWTPSGGFSWGGSQDIHSSGAWGSLKFTLTPKQLNEIRKKILFRTFRNWKPVSRSPHTKISIFQLWNDEVVGDPAFYQACLADLEKELDAYAARVTEDMSDADVADVYVNALPRWKGIEFEVEQLRREYLTNRLLQTGK